MNNKKLISFVMSVFMISSVRSDAEFDRNLITKCDHAALNHMKTADNIKASIGSNSTLFFMDNKAILHANKDLSDIGGEGLHGKYLIFDEEKAKEIADLVANNTAASGLIILALDKIMKIYNGQEIKNEYTHEDDHDKVFSNIAYSLFNSGSILSSEDKSKALEAFLRDPETYIKININTLEDADIKELFDFVKTTFYLDRDDSDNESTKNNYVTKRDALLNGFESSDSVDSFQVFALYVLDRLNSTCQKSVTDMTEQDTWASDNIKGSINAATEMVAKRIKEAEEVLAAEAEKEEADASPSPVAPVTPTSPAGSNSSFSSASGSNPAPEASVAPTSPAAEVQVAPSAGEDQGNKETKSEKSDSNPKDTLLEIAPKNDESPKAASEVGETKLAPKAKQAAKSQVSTSPTHSANDEGTTETKKASEAMVNESSPAVEEDGSDAPAKDVADTSASTSSATGVDSKPETEEVQVAPVSPVKKNSIQPLSQEEKKMESQLRTGLSKYHSSSKKGPEKQKNKEALQKIIRKAKAMNSDAMTAILNKQEYAFFY